MLREIFQLFQNKVVVPFADFSVGTVCSLKCRDCSQWLPYMKEQRVYPYKEMKKMFIDLAEQGRIGFIRIVTNGTICPDERVFELLKHTRVYVLISDYGQVLNAYQKENKKKLLEQLERYECKYYRAEKFDWINLGTLADSPEVCLAELEKSKGIRPKEEEMIDFSEISSKEELQKRLESFYSLDSLSSCRYCNPCEDRYHINPAIQL